VLRIWQRVSPLHGCGRRYETSWSLQSLTFGAVVAASGVDEITEFGYLSSYSLDFASTEYWLAIHDSECGRPCGTRVGALESLETGAFAAGLSFLSFYEVTKFGYLSSHSLGLVPSDEDRLVILDSIGDGMYVLWYAVLFATMDSRTRRVGRSRVSRPGFNEDTEFGSGLSAFFG
jgi:hypothetical protein